MYSKYKNAGYVSVIICLFCLCKMPADAPLNTFSIISYSKAPYSIDLYWSSYQDSDFERYEVCVKSDSETSYDVVSTITAFNQTYTLVSDLKPNTVYTVFVRAITTSGKSYDTKSITLQTYNDIPSAFEITALTLISASSFMVSWTPYLDQIESKFAYYAVYYSTVSGFVPSDITLYQKLTNVLSTDCYVYNLKDKSTYYVKIRTYNELGKYSESPEKSIFVKNIPPDPVSLNVPSDDQITENSVILSWTESTNSDFAKYEVHQTTNMVNVSYSPGMDFIPSDSTRIATIFDKKTTTYQVNNLIKNGEYFYKIVTYDSLGESSPSGWLGITATTGGGPVPVDILGFSGNRSTYVQVTWSPAQTKYLSLYQVYMDTKPDFVPSVLNLLGRSSSTSFRIGSQYFSGQTIYYCKIAVFNLMGRNSYSVSKQVP